MIPIHKLSGRLGNLMFQYAYLYSQAKRGIIPDVYVQSEEFFEDYKDDIKVLYKQGIYDELDKVAIHVRRGDYVNNPFYVDLMKTDYYERAMALFPNEKFIIFSDDIEWCKKQPLFQDCEFSEGDEIEDINLMASCNGIIMANSSFSWWAAYLSKEGTMVVAPREWYSDGKQRTKLLDTWIRI